MDRLIYFGVNVGAILLFCFFSRDTKNEYIQLYYFISTISFILLTTLLELFFLYKIKKNEFDSKKYEEQEKHLDNELQRKKEWAEFELYQKINNELQYKLKWNELDEDAKRNTFKRDFVKSLSSEILKKQSKEEKENDIILMKNMFKNFFE